MCTYVTQGMEGGSGKSVQVGTLIRDDLKVKEAIEGGNVLSLQFHQKCYDAYTHRNDLDKLKRYALPDLDVDETCNKPSNSSRKSIRKRGRLGKLLFSLNKQNNFLDKLVRSREEERNNTEMFLIKVYNSMRTRIKTSQTDLKGY